MVREFPARIRGSLLTHVRERHSLRRAAVVGQLDGNLARKSMISVNYFLLL
jgi:hypothetical protein